MKKLLLLIPFLLVGCDIFDSTLPNEPEPKTCVQYVYVLDGETGLERKVCIKYE